MPIKQDIPALHPVQMLDHRLHELLFWNCSVESSKFTNSFLSLVTTDPLIWTPLAPQNVS